MVSKQCYVCEGEFVYVRYLYNNTGSLIDAEELTESEFFRDKYSFIIPYVKITRESYDEIKWIIRQFKKDDSFDYIHSLKYSWHAHLDEE